MGVKQTNGNDPTGQGGIVWTNEKRRLGDLTPWPRNPRQIKKAEAARLAESLDDFGQVDVFAVGPDGELYNGHQRLAVWSREHGPDFEVDVRVSSRPLSEKERERLTVLLHRGAVGSWDFDLLANEFEPDELIAWGFDDWELGIQGAGETPDLADLANEYGDPGERDFWPFIRVQVAPETFQRWQSLIRSLPGEDEANKAAQILEAVDVTVLGSV